MNDDDGLLFVLLIVIVVLIMTLFASNCADTVHEDQLIVIMIKKGITVEELKSNRTVFETSNFITRFETIKKSIDALKPEPIESK